MLNGAETRYASDINRISDRVFDMAVAHAKDRADSLSFMESVTKSIGGLNEKIRKRDRLIVTIFSVLCGLHLPVSAKVIIEFSKYIGSLY